GAHRVARGGSGDGGQAEPGPGGDDGGPPDTTLVTPGANHHSVRARAAVGNAVGGTTAPIQRCSCGTTACRWEGRPLTSGWSAMYQTYNPLLDALKRRGAGEAALERASPDAEQTGRSLPAVLINDNIVTEDQLTEASAEANGF